MSAPDWLADAVFYQIFPERFANSDPSLDPPNVVPWDSEPTRDNFLGGDLGGITEHLDHIVSLGVNALYLTPFFKAGTNHRYDCADYFSIDPHAGTLEDFHNLIDACHERGIRVVLDAVLNHCGDQHPFFRDVVENQESSPYVNWFSVEDFPVVTDPAPNFRTCSGCTYMPKWNAYNPEVREHHYQVARYWIEQGIDGWRLDVPYFINLPFWRGFRDVVKGIDPNLCIIAEEWREPYQWLTGDTADSTMNYTLRDLILGFVADKNIDAHEFAAGMNRLHDRIPEGSRHAMLNLLGSHDTERILTHCKDSLAATKDCYTLLFAAEGAPMLYYGDEVGMRGDNDPGCRAGMTWDKETWETSLLGHIRSLSKARAAHESLRRGTQAVRAVDCDTVIVTRSLPTEQVEITVRRDSGSPLNMVIHKDS